MQLLAIDTCFWHNAQKLSINLQTRVLIIAMTQWIINTFEQQFMIIWNTFTSHELCANKGILCNYFFYKGAHLIPANRVQATFLIAVSVLS